MRSRLSTLVPRIVGLDHVTTTRDIPDLIESNVEPASPQPASRRTDRMARLSCPMNRSSHDQACLSEFPSHPTAISPHMNKAVRDGLSIPERLFLRRLKFWKCK